MICIALRKHLLTVTGMPDVYLDLSPQHAPLPRIVLRLMPGGRREYHSLAATDLVFADVEVTIQAVKITDCHAIYHTIREAIDFMRGDWDGTTIDCCRLSPPHSRLNLPIFGDEQGVPSLVCTAEVAYRESVLSS